MDDMWGRIDFLQKASSTSSAQKLPKEKKKIKQEKSTLLFHGLVEWLVFLLLRQLI